MTFTEIVNWLNGIAWGPWMLILLVGTGIYLTFRVGFLQLRKFGYAMKNTIGKIFQKQTAGEGEITPFQAMSTALAATVGTGNIAGVTGAIVIGGPGAVFWMWVSAFFGMVTKYSEVVLAIRYRERNEKGDWVGGPMYYIKNGLGQNWKWLGVVFSVLACLAAFGIGNMTQINTIATSINTAVNSFGVDTAAAVTLFCREFLISNLIIGVVIATIVGIVLFALSTVLSWALYGSRCFEFLFGAKLLPVYQIAFVLVCVIGASMELEVVWNIADTLNGFMAIPNLVALLGLSGVVIKLTKEHFAAKN